MRRILVVDDDLHTRLAIRPEADNPACLKMALSLGATRCLNKPFRPATLLTVIDQCLSEAEPHRMHAASLAAVAAALRPPPRRLGQTRIWSRPRLALTEARWRG